MTQFNGKTVGHPVASLRYPEKEETQVPRVADYLCDLSVCTALHGEHPCVTLWGKQELQEEPSGKLWSPERQATTEVGGKKRINIFTVPGVIEPLGCEESSLLVLASANHWVFPQEHPPDSQLAVPPIQKVYSLEEYISAHLSFLPWLVLAQGSVSLT